MSLRAQLADEYPSPPHRGPRPRLTAEQHSALHPEVYEALRVLALQAVRAGRRRLGMRALWERMRWELELRTGDVPYKLDNCLAPGYARLLTERELELSDVFEFRGRR